VSNQDRECHVEIYTDGGCDPNPGPGGWGAILISGTQIKELSGAAPESTNNRMELTAAIEALSALKRPCTVSLFTDSTYLRDGITRWLARWQARDWLKADGTPVENKDLWFALAEAQRNHQVEWHWIRGHRGHRWNERADELAREARQRLDAGARQHADERHTTEPGQALPAYDIYARGCALGNPGPAGYGAVILGPLGETLRSGGWPIASNNVMELWAIVAALQALDSPARVTIHTPSKYVIDGATRWLPRWERSGWRTQSGQPVKNPELWQELANVMGDHDIVWQHAASSEADPHAERAMALARAEAERQQ